MAKKRGLRMRLSSQRAEALLEICDEMIEEFDPADQHQLLLHEYLHELKEKLADMLKRNQELYTLCLVRSESLAFCQLWNMLDIRRDKYAHLIVSDLLNKIYTMAA